MNQQQPQQAEFPLAFDLNALDFAKDRIGAGRRFKEPSFNGADISPVECQLLANFMLQTMWKQISEGGASKKAEWWEWIDRADLDLQAKDHLSFDMVCALIGWNGEDVRTALYERFGRDPGERITEQAALGVKPVIASRVGREEEQDTLDPTRLVLLTDDHVLHETLEKMQTTAEENGQDQISQIYPVHLLDTNESNLSIRALTRLKDLGRRVFRGSLNGWFGRPKSGSLTMKRIDGEWRFRVTIPRSAVLGSPWLQPTH